jgi:hypothetical protein
MKKRAFLKKIVQKPCSKVEKKGFFFHGFYPFFYLFVLRACVPVRSFVLQAPLLSRILVKG